MKEMFELCILHQQLIRTVIHNPRNYNPRSHTKTNISELVTLMYLTPYPQAKLSNLLCPSGSASQVPGVHHSQPGDLSVGDVWRP